MAQGGGGVHIIVGSQLNPGQDTSRSGGFWWVGGTGMQGHRHLAGVRRAQAWQVPSARPWSKVDAKAEKCTQ